MKMEKFVCIADIARQVISTEIEALQRMSGRLDQNFERAISLIQNMTGRVVVIGMGKSGIIGKKIAATLASTGTSAFFVHPGEAFHGDLGMIKPSDVALLISNSGETEEIVRLVPFFQWRKNKTIAMTGDTNSTLAKHADVVLDVSVEKEACSNNLAPTCSTTATLVMGDSLSVALSTLNKFQPEDFARFHPGGSLGRKLLTHVRDVMRTDLPIVSPETTFHDCLFTMTAGRMGLAVAMENDKLAGIVTDGDLRRAMVADQEIMYKPVKQFMHRNPYTVDADTKFAEAESYMIEKKIRLLIVTADAGSTICGVVELFNNGFSAS